MNTWVPFGCSVIGASHIRKGVENQDSFDALSKKGLSVIAISDGHGGSKYVRSAIGSKLATTTASKIASENMELSSKMSKEELNSIIHHMKNRFLLSWQKEVNADIAKKGRFSAAEFTILEENCSTKVLDAVLETPRIAYGCTFLCAITYEDLVLILYYGDGNVLGLYDEEVRELTEDDPRNIANETLSLCTLKDAREISHKVLIGDEIPRLIMISTDGVKNSFDDMNEEEIKKFYNIPIIIKDELIKRQGETTKIEQGLEKMLERITTMGSGDDVTIAVLFNKQGVT